MYLNLPIFFINLKKTQQMELQWLSVRAVVFVIFGSTRRGMILQCGWLKRAFTRSPIRPWPYMATFSPTRTWASCTIESAVSTDGRNIASSGLMPSGTICIASLSTMALVECEEKVNTIFPIKSWASATSSPHLVTTPTKLYPYDNGYFIDSSVIPLIFTSRAASSKRPLKIFNSVPELIKEQMDLTKRK